MLDDIAVLEQLLHPRQMALGVRDERIEDLLQRSRAAPFSRGCGRSVYTTHDVRTCGDDAERRLLVECPREVLGRAQLDDGVQHALRDRARLRLRVPVAHEAQEPREVRSGQGAQDLVDGGVAGDRLAAGRCVVGVRVCRGRERGEEGVQAAGLGHAEGEEDGVSVIVQGEVVGEVLLSVQSDNSVNDEGQTGREKDRDEWKEKRTFGQVPPAGSLSRLAALPCSLART